MDTLRPPAVEPPRRSAPETPAGTVVSAEPTPRWVAIVVLLAGAAAVLTVMNAHLLLVANTPTGGDMGAHVYAPAYLRDVLLPSGRIIGWSNDWFAGFPIFYFYFPLPSLVIVLLDLVLPYGVAFKLVTVMGLVALPAATYFFVRSLGVGRGVAAVAAAAGGSFVFMESYMILGANIPSTLAGEFSFSWSFALGIAYLGALVRGLRDDRRWLLWAGVLLGLTALTHVITTIAFVVASLPLLLWRGAAGRTIGVWAFGFALSAFWALPLLARFGLTADMAWSPLRRWSDVVPMEVWFLALPAVVGMVWILRRSPRALPLLTLAVVPIVYFWLPTVLPRIFPNVFGDGPWKLWNGRLLPFWFYALHVFAGIGVGALLHAWGRRLPERLGARPLLVIGGAAGAGAAIALFEGLSIVLALAALAVLVVATLALGARTEGGTIRSSALLPMVGASVFLAAALASVTYIPSWARWNYTGYEGKGEAWEEYSALMETVDGLPPGRIQWEANSELNRYGTPMSLMLFPYWTEYSHASMEGLFFESALTTPFHFLNAGEMSYAPSNPIPGLRYHTFAFERGLRHLELYGVRYYVAFTEEAKQKARATSGLTFVESSPPWEIYRLPPSSLVDVAAFQPAVYEGAAPHSLLHTLATVPARIFGGGEEEGEEVPSFGELALDWYDDLSLLDRWVVAEGPEDWPRIGSLDELPAIPIETSGTVSDVVLEDHRISFRTTAVGVPHLVKVSYFPNWRAEGAEGPYRATPSLMVVVPTQEEVVLQFERLPAEQGGMALTALAIAVLGVAVVRRRRDRVTGLPTPGRGDGVVSPSSDGPRGER